MTPVKLLPSPDIAQFLSLWECIPFVETAFAAYANEGNRPGLFHIDGQVGEFHIKAGCLTLDGRTFFALKANGGFFQNRALCQLPKSAGPTAGNFIYVCSIRPIE